MRAALVASLFASSATFLGAGRAGAATDHVVQPGESLSAIAARYGLPVETLLDVNGLTDPDQVQAGTVLSIPEFASAAPAPEAAADSGRYYTVREGDTLSSVASLYGLDPATIADVNGIFDEHSVIAGATLLIPEGGGATAAEAVTDSGLRHTVAAGEFLSGIADSYGVRVEAIVAANGLDNPNWVVEGQDLIIPGALETGPATGAASSVVHVVGQGETLSSIAERYGVELSRLADANNLANHDLIVLGERVVIPGALTPSQTTGFENVSHVVQLGDTLSGLAAQYSVSLDELVSANGLSNPDVVLLGASLAIPGGAASASVAPVAPATPAVATHVVAAGENLATIAARYGASQSAIAELNGLTDPNRIIEGDVLSIPGVTPGRIYSIDEYESILVSAATQYGIPIAWLKALAWQESGWNQFVVSHAGAIGLMQIMPYTADWALLTLVPDAVDWETNPVDNARMGAAILHHWLVRSDWSLETALGAYFQGWRSLHEIGVYEETEVYIASVLALVGQFE